MSTAKQRIDKWLWAVRICKTRTQANRLCQQGKISVNGLPAKPSRLIGSGDVVAVRKGAFSFLYRVLNHVISQRLPARQVADYFLEITPPEVLDQYKAHCQAMKAWQQKGRGRPTKKDRRDLDNFFDW
jgi:ribosome-associated heat shock protein Hsp15